jgi:CRISPR-associated Csx2 family protein
LAVHLISILGLPRKVEGDRSYLTATYRFPDGVQLTTPTFGLALEAWCHTRNENPLPLDRVLWLGTTTSAWGSLVQAVLGVAAVNEAVYLDLYEGSPASQHQVDIVAEILTRSTGRTHACRIIPPCADLPEQEHFVSLLGAEVSPGDRVVLDLTHGLRNQSLMLAQSALVLEGAFGVRIEGLYYGGLEIPRAPGEPAPAVDLTGLLVQARRAQALAAFRESGDLRLLARQMPEGGFRRQIEALGQAVAINDMAQALRLAKSALGELPSAGLGILESLVAKGLRDYCGTLSESQFTLARGCIDRGEWTRAITCMFEGAISREAQRQGLKDNRFQGGRDFAKKALGKTSETFAALTYLRNQVAHGVVDPSHKRFKLPWWGPLDHDGLVKIAKSPERLRTFLIGALKAIQIEANESGLQDEIHRD